MDATSGAGTACQSGVPEFTPIFRGVVLFSMFGYVDHCLYFLLFTIVLSVLLFTIVLSVLLFTIVLSVLLFTIVLSVLLFTSSNYSDFLKHHLHLRNRLLDQGYKKIRLIRSLKKFIFRYQYLVEIYSVSAEKIISDAFSYSENV